MDYAFLSPMAQVKGSAITTRIKYVRESFGEAGYRRLRDALTEESRGVIEARVMPHEWVPYSAFIDLNVTADKLFGTGDLSLCYQMGRYGAEVNLPTLYRIFYKLGTPHFIFHKAARLWEMHYDSGRLVPLSSGPKSLRIRIEDFESPHRAHCLSVLGWATKSVEMSGADVSTSEENLCRTRGDDACEMSLAWV